MNICTSKLLRICLFASATLIATHSAQAQDGSWTYDGGVAGNNTWTNPSSWSGGTIANGSNSTATLGNVITADRVITLGGNRTIGNITASDTSNNYTLSGDTLTLDRTDATAPQINVTTSGRTLTISSQISGSDGLTKVSAGSTLSLGGNNDYTGITTISGGTIAISSNNALGSTAAGSHTTFTATGSGPALFLSNNITSPENITIGGQTESSGFAGAIQTTAGNNILSGNITLDGSGSGIRVSANAASSSLTFSGNVTQAAGKNNNFTLFANNASAIINVDKAVNINGGILFVYGSGVSVLKGAGSVMGSTGIDQGGTLRLGVSDALTISVDLGIGTSGTNTGTFDLASFNQTVRGLTSASTGATRRVINSTVSSNSTLTVGNGGGNFTFSGTILNNGGTGGIVSLVKTGAGNQTLSGVNTYTGGTRIDAGILTLGHATDTLATAGAINVNGGTLALGANSDTVGAVTLTSGNITSTTGVLTGTSYGVQSGSVSAILGGSGVALTKTTSGTVTLTANNTYTGATSVNGGTLLVNGSISASSAVTVGLSGILGGNGTINGATTVNGLLAPGNSPGILTFNGTLALAGNTTLEIDGLTRGTEYDGVNTVGALTYGGGLTFDFGTTLSSNATFDLFSIGGGGQTGNFSTVALTGNHSGSFTQNGTVWELTDGGGNNWNFSQATGDLTFIAVPEPTTISLLASGVAFLGLRLARRRRS